MWLIVLFWVFFGLVVHPYVTYPIIMLFWSILRPRPLTSRPIEPHASLVIAAFNEEDTIAERIENALALEYPHDRLEIIIASDGSTDATNQIVHGYAADDERISLLNLPRAGKSAALNAAVREAKGEIIVLSDAATRFSSDVLRKLVAYFADPQVQCVVGKVTLVPREEAPYNLSESLYWRYEMRLRELEGVAGIAFIGSGPCMAVRKRYYPLLEENAMDDLTPTIQLIKNGGRIVHVSDLGAYDYMDGQTATQIEARSRRVTLSLSSIWQNRAILNPFRYPHYCFSIFSHKIIRWLLGLWLLGMLVTAGALGLWYSMSAYRYIFYAQLAFYALASVGALVGHTRVGKMAVFSVPMAVCVVSAAFLKGFVRFIFGGQAATWHPAKSGGS